jgi:hypothetical protein
MKTVRRLRWAQGLVGGVCAGILAAASLPQDNRPTWSNNTTLLYVAVIGVALSAAVIPIAEAIASKFGFRSSLLTKEVTELLHVEFPLVVRASGMPNFSALGMHVFLKRRTWRHPLQGVQRRVARVRLANVGVDYELDWVKGKGVIGACWRDLRDKGLNYAAWVRRHQGIGGEAWNSLPEAERWGLTYEEFDRTATKFGAIVATPIFDQGGKFLGTVSADGPPGSYAGLKSDAAGQRLQACAQVIARYLEHMSD